MTKVSRKKNSHSGGQRLLDGDDFLSRAPDEADPVSSDTYDAPLAHGDTHLFSGEKKPGFLERFRSHMSAVAYAEAGEYTAATELIDSSRRENSVLLVIEGEDLAPSTLSYALNLCRRTKSHLDILQVIERPGEDQDYESLGRALSQVSANIVKLVQKTDDENIPIKVTIRLGDMNQKLVNYAQRHNEVAMVILESSKIRCTSADHKAWKRIVEGLAQKVSVPLITVDPREPVCAR
jgi:hypothetical protein